MRSFAILGILFFSPSSPIAAETLLGYVDKVPPGTYQTIRAKSVSECSQHCQKDTDFCRGHIAVQPDMSQNLIICYLNDGLDPASPYWTQAPEAIDLQKALDDLNAYRAQHSLLPLKLNQNLIAASQMHSDDMEQMGDVSHTGSDGQVSGDRAQIKGYDFSILAENVAGGQASWDAVFKAWQDSPGHNENLLRNDITEFGAALSFDRQSSYQYYWTMLVGSPYQGPN